MLFESLFVRYQSGSLFVSSSVSFLLATPIRSDTTPHLTPIPLTPNQRLWREAPAALAEEFITHNLLLTFSPDYLSKITQIKLEINS
jgi:hypothetical protein